MAYQELTADTFNAAVDRDGITLIDFWAPWCGPCKMFGPTFEAASERHADIAFVALEYGTFGPPHGENALRDDAWLWQHGDPRGRDAQPIRQALLDYFYPPREDWKEMVLWRARQVYRQALAGMAGGAAA